MIMRSTLVATVATALAIGLSVAAPISRAEEQGRSVLIILDASGSMNAKMSDGQARFAAAQAAVSEMLLGQPDDVRVGLRVYGHQSDPSQKNCNDIELVGPIDAIQSNRPELLSRVGDLRARGYTPITLSLQQAAQDLAPEPTTERVVVLVSDGRETCSADPCLAARALASANASLVIHTIGLAVDAAARTQLQCVASVARGSYYDVSTSRQLTERLAEAAANTAAGDTDSNPSDGVGYLSVEGVAEFGLPILAEDGEVIGSVGTVDPKKALPGGIYSVKFPNGTWTGIEIRSGETTVIEPAYLEIKTQAPDNFYLVDSETGEELGGFFMEGAPAIAVIPGRYSAKTSLPFLWTDITLEPGTITVVEPALLRIVHGPENADSVFYRVVDLGSGIEGSVVNGNAFAVPPGKYRIEDPDREGVSVDVEVEAGEIKDIAIDR